MSGASLAAAAAASNSSSTAAVAGQKRKNPWADPNFSLAKKALGSSEGSAAAASSSVVPAAAASASAAPAKPSASSGPVGGTATGGAAAGGRANPWADKSAADFQQKTGPPAAAAPAAAPSSASAAPTASSTAAPAIAAPTSAFRSSSSSRRSAVDDDSLLLPLAEASPSKKPRRDVVDLSSPTPDDDEPTSAPSSSAAAAVSSSAAVAAAAVAASSSTSFATTPFDACAPPIPVVVSPSFLRRHANSSPTSFYNAIAAVANAAAAPRTAPALLAPITEVDTSGIEGEVLHHSGWLTFIRLEATRCTCAAANQRRGSSNIVTLSSLSSSSGSSSSSSGSNRSRCAFCRVRALPPCPSSLSQVRMGEGHHRSTLTQFLELYRPSQVPGAQCAWIDVRLRNGPAEEEAEERGDYTGLTAAWKNAPVRNTETLRALAKRYGCVSGKWLIYSKERVDVTWSKVATALLRRNLPGVSAAKISPSSFGESAHVMCVYTPDFSNEQQVMAVREALRECGITWRLHYKADAWTNLDIYARNPDGIKATIYSA